MKTNFVKVSVYSLAAVLALAVGACNSSANRPQVQPVRPVQPQVQPQNFGPVLLQDGTCSEQAPAVAMTIDAGIGECDLVRLKGKPPTDVLIGESGRGGRETQVLYAEPTGRELYFFINNKLDRTVK
ncbi:hypothetical protein WJT86_05600 [Microvirga sp. W0021]|uniref:Lipoprotein n=1 Tax=Hohaiivirga grylli TaxID=3133970 RepID=A0ABV0BHU4_9HYPH